MNHEIIVSVICVNKLALEIYKGFLMTVKLLFVVSIIIVILQTLKAALLFYKTKINGHGCLSYKASSVGVQSISICVVLWLF